MSVQKTYTIVIKYEKGDAGTEHQVPAGTRGKEATSYTVPVLDSGDLAYTELRKIVLKRLNNVVPVSQGITSAHIVGTVSES